MKLAIACYPTYGGSGVMATELGLALAERGHEVHFGCAGVSEADFNATIHQGLDQTFGSVHKQSSSNNNEMNSE